MHPLFVQANERNYHTEAMVHIVWFQKISIAPDDSLICTPTTPQDFPFQGVFDDHLPLSLSRIFEQGLRLPSLEIQSGLVLENKETEY